MTAPSFDFRPRPLPLSSEPEIVYPSGNQRWNFCLTGKYWAWTGRVDEMHSFKMVPLGAIATLLLGAVVVNDATGNEPATEVMVCNSTDTDVLVAASYRPVGEDRYLRRGWFRVGASSCETLFETRGRYVYLYAERDGQSGYWGGERNLCVDYTAPFRFYSSESNTCTRQQETVPFQEFELSEGQRNLPWILH